MGLRLILRDRRKEGKGSSGEIWKITLGRGRKGENGRIGVTLTLDPMVTQIQLLLP